ncbi:serine protease [Reyranella sp. CPCC 100927]|uniref:S1 family peptidase n=1 Tax=Reyranella sp. CPCC 100927 TaxID=2599616 RepID=UPI0011B5DF3D|nr:serine protease [Reyranella sp. CPCC 100927]TWS98470.1 trypsin-like peptidase domain-containing protein [Reyranella sp. CPCC 100927]
MRAFLIWLAIVGVLAAIYAVIPNSTREQGRRPLPPEVTKPLPPEWARPGPGTPPSPSGPGPSTPSPQPPSAPPTAAPQPPLRGQDFVLTVNSDGPRSADGLGTAFALDSTGVWLTAAHVVDDCKAVYVLRGRDWRAATAVRIHPSADIALIRAVNTGPTITFAAAGAPRLGTDAYHVGYPQSRPAQVHTRYIGRARIERPERGMPPEPGQVWVEVSRAPDFEGSLGGLSGGPAFDSSGRVVGVTILESSRRGRVTTAPVERIRDLLVRGGIDSQPGAGVATFNPTSFQATGDSLRAAGTVTHVYCSWQGNTRPRRR